MIRVSTLTRRYGTVLALDAVSFTVEQGQILGFLGPNGAGKTTTMKILTGFLAPTTGRAWIAGRSVDGRDGEFRHAIGYLPENAPAYPEMSVRAYLHFVAGLRGLRGSARARAIESAIERCGLAEMAGRDIRTLSKGYRQRVGLAQAILHDPQILILDEPTSGLDPNQVAEIRALIRQLGEQKTIIFSSHILQDVQAVANRVLILNRGRIVADDHPEQLGEAITGGRLRMTVRGLDASQLADALSPLDGVDGVQFEAPVTGARSAGGQVVELSAPDPDARASAARAIIEAGGDLLEMRPARADLETVFRRLTEDDR